MSLEPGQLVAVQPNVHNGQVRVRVRVGVRARVRVRVRVRVNIRAGQLVANLHNGRAI